jgi:hypothetical protein
LGCTITLKEQALVLFAPFVAVQVTAVVPELNAEPEAGEQFTVTPAQLSVAVGAV